jgi:hypothetical protein
VHIFSEKEQSASAKLAGVALAIPTLTNKSFSRDSSFCNTLPKPLNHIRSETEDLLGISEGEARSIFISRNWTGRRIVIRLSRISFALEWLHFVVDFLAYGRPADHHALSSATRRGTICSVLIAHRRECATHTVVPGTQDSHLCPSA